MHKRVLPSCIVLLISSLSFSQNVGIGIVAPTKAKFEVAGVSGTGSTNAVFGSTSSGISLQQNYPTIGFNQYRDNTVGNGRYMANGYAAIQYLDPGNGALAIDMLGPGVAAGLTNNGNRSITILNNGNVGIRNVPSEATLTVSRGNATNTAVFFGTSYHSLFNNSGAENTYIRGGKNGSTVIINDITNGNIQMGNGTTKVGINTLPLAPAAALEINGGLSLRTAFSTVAAEETIVVGDRSYIVVFGTTPSPNLIHLSNGISEGQLLILRGNAGNQPGIAVPVLDDETNLEVNGLFRIRPNDTITLIWAGNKWVELCRSNNTF